MANVLERFEQEKNAEQMAAMREYMKLNYDEKIALAETRVRQFYREAQSRDLSIYVSVGGLDSITLLCFIRKLGFNEVPAISASYLEDKSIQEIHKQLGVMSVHPVKDKQGREYTKAMVLQEFGFPVLSKEIAAKIETLQNQTPESATFRHAIITGETGEHGGYRTGTRMKLSQKWLEKFAGYENEAEGVNYQIAPFKVSSKCCYYLKERPCEQWAKEHNSVPLLGLMASEGGSRKKGLLMHGCNYFGKTTARGCPFAFFSRQDLLQLALDLRVPVPEIYGKIVRDADGTLRTTKAQRTGCTMCGFGITLEKRPHRFDQLLRKNPKEWQYWMYRCCKDDNGEYFGWAKVLDYIGVGYDTPEKVDVNV